MTIPYDLRSPETIAKEYGGDKQKIAKAIQQGLIKPEEGVMAGMLLDRMRNAQGAEQAGLPS